MMTITLCVLLAQFVQNIGGIKSSIVTQLPWDDLQGLSNSANEQLLLASNRPRVVPQHFGELHLDSTTT